MKNQINEIKRMQLLAGIISLDEAALGVNVISNPIPGPPSYYKDRKTTFKPAERPDGAYKVQLKIDGKPVMSTTADGNPSPEELSDVLTALESSYKSKFDFEKAELVVLDSNGKQVGSVTKRDNFLKTKATYVGDTYSTTHGTV